MTLPLPNTLPCVATPFSPRWLTARPACAIALFCVVAFVAYPNAALLAGEAQTLGKEAVVRLLSENCFDCHGNGESEGDFQIDELLQFDFDAPDLSHEAILQNRLRWDAVLKNVRAGTMPPPDNGYELSSQQRKQLNNWIKLEGLGINPREINPGNIPIRRLNRREYSSTIRDLMGIDFNAEIVFPIDDTSSGFDTVGDALGFSPMTMEKYLESAKAIVDESVPRVRRVIPTVFENSRIRTEQGQSASDLNMAKAWDIRIDFSIDASDEYRVNVLLEADGSFEYCPDRCKVDIKVDNSLLHTSEYGWDENRKFPLAFDMPLEAGKHTVALTVRPSAPAPELIPDNPQEATAQPAERLPRAESSGISQLRVRSIRIDGPTDPDQWIAPEGFDRFFTRQALPESPAELREYAEEVLRRFATRAFRRPPNQATVDRLADVAQRVMEAGEPFEEGIAQAMITVLASPRFLLRVEGLDESSVESEDRYPLIDQYALASRLSYFLWSTMPDQELFDLAAAGKLREQLSEQVDRMLRDRRSNAMLASFVGQWLRTDDVSKVVIDTLAAYGLRDRYDRLREEYISFPEAEDRTPEQEKRRDEIREEFGKLRPFRDALSGEMRSAMRQETEMLFEYIVREDRPLIELINPGYTFLNQTLAELYDIDGVQGDEMRRVELAPDASRGGLLTQGTLLIVTSNPTRTSPVKRGLYVLENILGTPTPPAPPNVPELEQSKDRFGGREPTLRELLAAHRESALCSSCHSRMDPLGLALENFNAFGKWRDVEADQPIDAAGKLITGEKFSSVVELRKIIATDRRADFYRCVTQKLFVYALGRGMEHFDQYTCDEIVDTLESGDGSFRSLVHAIVDSPAFQRVTLPTSNKPNS